MLSGRMSLPEVGKKLRSVRRRLRLQAALDGAAWAARITTGLLFVLVLLWQLDLLGGRRMTALVVGAFALIVVGALVRALQRIPLERAAKRADVTHELHDRLGSALAFVQDPAPTPFMQLAIADAEQAAARVEPRRAAPLRRPKGLGPALAMGALALLVSLLHFPARPVARLEPPLRPPHLAVDPELLAPEREAAQKLEQEALATEDPETRALAKELQQVLAELDAGDLTRKQVFDKLATIEKKLGAPNEGNFEELKRQLKKAGAELGRENLTKAAGEALAKEDLQKAKQELEKLAEQAEKLDAEKKEASKDDKKLDEKQREELARSLDRAAKQEQQKSAEQKKQEQEEKRLKEEERKLKKELAEKPNDRELQRKLQRNQRELERLEREKQQRAEQKRQLERLQRELQKAAEQLRQKMSPEAAEALRKAAQQLGQMQNEIRKLGNQGRAQVQIAELKEMLRRAGSSQQSQQGQPGQDGKGQQAQNGQPQPGQGKNGQNKNGKGQDGKGSMLRDFNDRAGGEKVLVLDPNNPNPNGPMVLLPLPGDDKGGGGGEGDKDKGKGGQGHDQPGDGIGSEHDPNLMGDATRMAGRRHETRVQGKEGAGVSRSETILGSADKGFASRGYRKVYSDYTSVAEEVMSKEHVPPGYRYYIKRYFQLIKPRD